MAVRKKGEAGCRVYGGKTAKVTICLAPEVARRLRAFSAFHGLDLGDVVTEGLAGVLREFEVRQRVSSLPVRSPAVVGGDHDQPVPLQRVEAVPA